MLKFRIEVRNSDGKLYNDYYGNRIINFDIIHNIIKDNEEAIVKSICLDLHRKYKGVCKNGSEINIDVSYLNTISNTYSPLFSFYNNGEFIKH